jgi:hypothetical protein
VDVVQLIDHPLRQPFECGVDRCVELSSIHPGIEPRTPLTT